MVLERININKEKLDALEHDILLRRHIERYAIVRQYVYGKVVDCACGVGYGTYLLSKNPDVRKIYGVDLDKTAIETASAEFGSEESISFLQGDFESLAIEDVDVLISLETIEHCQNPEVIADFVLRCNAQEVIISFPSKITTHYNPYHLWDITPQNVIDIFSKSHTLLNNFSYTFDTQFLHFIKHHRKISFPKRFKG
ncbi:MAG: hypothetical protein RJA13_723 [Bacteroidota bacterium]|jgi:2-polyprenyl-3-methyl-5-hydroxy-6-metoxy-1,4-benzoquinol methylase